jgi:predicted transcriptional regulator
MLAFSTRDVAKKLGITAAALSRYIKDKKVPAPRIVKTGKASMHLWTEAEIEHVRQLLPKIANGRKTRYKKQSALSPQQLVKAKKKTQARVPAPHKKK